MIKNATRIMNSDASKDSAARTTKIRKETLAANINRVSWRQTSYSNFDSSEKKLNTKNGKNNTVSKAFENHKRHLEFLDPILEALPSKTLLEPAKDLASLVLSTAILRKNALATFCRTSNSITIPNSANFTDFELNVSDRVRNTKEFKAINEATIKKVSETKDFLKSSIIDCQKIEIKETKKCLQKTFIHNSLLLSNQIVRLYKIALFDPNMPEATNEKILSQVAIKNMLSGDLYEDTSDHESESDSIYSIDSPDNSPTSANIKTQSKVNFCKLLQFLGVKNNEEIIIFFDKYIDNATEKKNINKRAKVTILENIPRPLNTAPKQPSTSADSPTTNILPNSNDVTPPPTTPPPIPVEEISTLAPTSPPITNPILTHKFNDMDILILDATLTVLQKFIPILTVTVFEKYNKQIQWELAEAASQALYINTKRSQMTKDVSEIIDKEESVKAPILKSIINLGVKNEVSKLRQEIAHLNEKCKKAKENLENLKTLKNKNQNCDDDTQHPKERASDETQSTMAPSKGTTKVMTKRHLHQNKSWSRNPSIPQKERKNASTHGSMTPTVTTPNSSTTPPKSDQEKERKRLRNQRQRVNRAAKKRARHEDSPDDANNASKPPASPI